MQFFAPAKVNLFFKILGRRKDGFHEIETLMAPISLRDELTVQPNESTEGIDFSCDDPTLPGDGDNLVVRAARSFFAEIKIEPRVRIELRKKIPHGAGLGGGSSDAATTLRGLNELFGRPLTTARLTTMAAEIGSDVPFFMQARAAICRGRGEIVEPVDHAPKLALLLLKPDFAVATSWAYGRCSDSRELPGVSYTPQVLGDHRFSNDLERPVFEKYVFLAQMKSWLRKQAEVAAALLSGSGSTMFAVLRDATTAGTLAQRACAELDPSLWTLSCETVLRGSS